MSWKLQLEPPKSEQRPTAKKPEPPKRYTDKDIPRIREWAQNLFAKLQPNEGSSRLPPLREINHRIPLIDEQKVLKSYPP